MFEHEIGCVLDTSTDNNRISILYWMYHTARDYEYGGSSYFNGSAFTSGDAHTYPNTDDDCNPYPKTDPNPDTRTGRDV